MKLVPIVIGGVVFATAGLAASDEDHPMAGILYHTTENSSLTYECRPDGKDRLICDFNQTSVRLKIDDAGIEERIAGWRKQYLANPDTLKKANDTACAIGRATDDILTGKKSAENPVQLTKANEKARADMRALTDVLLRICKDQSLESQLSLVRWNSEFEKKTCVVSSNAFKQTFSRDLDMDGGWTVVPEQSGMCGVVHLDRFEPEKSTVAGITFTNWNYIARKAVTKRKSKDPICADLDEKEYKYNWKERTIDMNCEHIEFRPI
jgi:hypothetical protein